MKKEFAIKSNSGNLLVAFTEECKAMGWMFNDKFTCGERIENSTTPNIDGRKCIYFSNKFSAYPGQCTFASSNSSENPSFFLPQDWDKARQYAKEYFDENTSRIKTFKITPDYSAIISESDQTVTVGCQIIPFEMVMRVVKVVKEYTK